MKREDMMALAERCEQATGPDRLLDANIHWQVKRSDFSADEDYQQNDFCYARAGWTLNRADRHYLNSVPVPVYTASLDAAMGLVEDQLVTVIMREALARLDQCFNPMDSYLVKLRLFVTAACLRALTPAPSSTGPITMPTQEKDVSDGRI